mmetsp:Transcript_5200/g.3907  ORF Transcript_5200/g.3907 Transcript_5200/m.3907 type:complete len:221 (-) Transcript_5200:69-731(-)
MDALLYTYELALGNWDSGQFAACKNSLLATFLFLLSTMYLMIIMLNLLIAVISDVYSEIEESSEYQLYRNLADLVVENEGSIKSKDIRKHDEQGDYLYIAKIDKTEFDDGSVEEGLLKLRRTVNKRTYYLNNDQQKFFKELNKAIHINNEKYLSMLKEQGAKMEAEFKKDVKNIDLPPELTDLQRHGTSHFDVGQSPFIKGSSPETSGRVAKRTPPPMEL